MGGIWQRLRTRDPEASHEYKRYGRKKNLDVGYLVSEYLVFFFFLTWWTGGRGWQMRGYAISSIFSMLMRVFIF